MNSPRRSLLVMAPIVMMMGNMIGTRALALDPLVEGFRSPPNAAKPRVWWHWMNGNVTEDGVKLDLEWMKRVGIGGVQNFDAYVNWGGSYDTTSQVPNPVIYLSPAWQQTLRHSIELADQLGLEFAIASSAGWSESGGPWVSPQHAMKKLVWSETSVPGGKPFKGRLAAPPGLTGLFQNVPLTEFGSHAASTPHYYADVAVIAYRAPATDVPPSSLEPRVTSSAGAIDAARLSDGDLATPVMLPFGSSDTWIQFEFEKPQHIQALTAVMGGPFFAVGVDERPTGWLEANPGARTFQKIIALPKSGAPEQTVSFAPVSARVFRVIFDRHKPNLVEQAGLAPAAKAFPIAELVLQPAARVNRFEDKAGFSNRQILEEDDTPGLTEADVVHRTNVVDLTDRMRADGSLTWTPPHGRWVVLRFGYSLIGHTNSSGSPAGRGLEVDKLNQGYVKEYIETYLSHYEKALGPSLVGRRGLQYLLTDSFEAGAQNWTDDLLEQFRARRGYDARLWLPVLAGRVVESAAASDRFLWDFRKTLGDLIVEAHYGQISTAAHARGMGRYSESHEAGRAFIGDGMEAKKTADIPMGAMWVTGIPPGYSPETSDVDIRESASVAHIYGKPFVAAESLTTFMMNPNNAKPSGIPIVCFVQTCALYGFSPEDLKPLLDRELAMGLNRFVLHASVHQPDSRPGPGMGLGPYGQWITRKETWAEQSASWFGYLARSSYLLQQGAFVADIVYLYGEDTNATSLFHAGSIPPIPAGYNYDFINPDGLGELAVKDGRLVTRSGMSYRVLALDASTHRLSVPVLRKIRDLVQAGAVVIGAKPVATPSLADDEDEFRALVVAIWGGKAIPHPSLAEALPALQIAPDVAFTKQPNETLRFVHRKLPDGELYFVSSDLPQPHIVQASFRVSGKAPELWRADTGSITPLSYRVEDGRTIVPLQLEANDAVFVVFRHSNTEPSMAIAAPVMEKLNVLDGPWKIRFPPNLGAPAEARFEQLTSWTDSIDAGVKYFSGTASYEKRISVPRKWLNARASIWLDLGAVKNLAEVVVNDHSFDVLWKTPFRTDITAALKPGENRLEIKVTNLWPNRMIGDKQPGKRPIAYASFDPFKADTALLPSGLLGPVTLWRQNAQ